MCGPFVCCLSLLARKVPLIDFTLPGPGSHHIVRYQLIASYEPAASHTKRCIIAYSSPLFPLQVVSASRGLAACAHSIWSAEGDRDDNAHHLSGVCLQQEYIASAKQLHRQRVGAVVPELMVDYSFWLAECLGRHNRLSTPPAHPSPVQ